MKRSRESEEGISPTRGTDNENDSAESSGTIVPAFKIVDLDLQDGDSHAAMRCYMPGHKEGLAFSSYDEYAAHYNSAHTNRCLECHKNFPSSLLLNIHIEESHDAFLAAKREKGEKTYSCFVEGCERKCSTPEKRRLHLIDKHMYPRNYFFAVTKAGIDGRRSMLVENGCHRRQSSSHGVSRASGRRSSKIDVKPETGKKALEEEKTAVKDTKNDKSEEVPDVEMDDLAGAMSALQFVPSSVRFGRKEKVAFARR